MVTAEQLWKDITQFVDEMCPRIAPDERDGVVERIYEAMKFLVKVKP